MPFAGHDDPKQFVVFLTIHKVAMVVGCSGDLAMHDLASAIVAISQEQMYCLIGATVRCFYFTIPAANLVIWYCCFKAQSVATEAYVVLQGDATTLLKCLRAHPRSKTPSDLEYHALDFIVSGSVHTCSHMAIAIEKHTALSANNVHNFTWH